jgi:DNA repair protein RAD5
MRLCYIDGTIQSEFSNRSKKKSTGSSIFNLSFRRVILDESHLIKNPTTAVSKACCSINADRRWCVTGTPIINSLHDVFGLLKFLKHEPWCNSSFWKNAITRVMNHGPSDSDNSKEKDVDGDSNGMRVALGRVRRVLGSLLLRRTKDSLDNNGYVNCFS